LHRKASRWKGGGRSPAKQVSGRKAESFDAGAGKHACKHNPAERAISSQPRFRANFYTQVVGRIGCLSYLVHKMDCALIVTTVCG